MCVCVLADDDPLCSKNQLRERDQREGEVHPLCSICVCPECISVLEQRESLGDEAEGDVGRR